MTTKPQNINLSESGRVPFLRHVEAHLAETSRDTTTEFVSQGPHGSKAPSGRRTSGESGRSMVEMLGTLAIMGVLSVGAVAGYRYAIDKFNSNTILNEISKRAMTASQQRLVGQPINLNEYGAAEIQGYTVGHTNDVDGDTAFFSLSVSNVPKGICDKVIENKLRTATEVWLNTNTDVTDGGTCDDNENGNTIEFVFANTLDPNATPTEPTPACDPACTGGQECQNGTCVCPTDTPKWNGTSCEACPTGTSADNTGGSVDGTACKCPIDTPVWDMFTQSCRAKSTNCTVNDDCKGATASDGTSCDEGNGCYCKVTSYSGCDSTTGVRKPTGGTCTALPAATITDTGSGFTKYTLEGTPQKTVYKGGSKMNWWSANNLCQAYGKNLFDPAWLDCYDKTIGVNGAYSADGSYWGYCNKDTTGIKATNSSATRSDNMQAFQKAFDNGGLYWTRNGRKYSETSSADGKCTTSGCNSCHAFTCSTASGNVNHYGLYDDVAYALCE